MEAFYTKFMIPLKDYLLFNFLGGPRPVQLRYMINLQKGGTFPVMLCLMAYYNNWTMSAYLYAANHGSYGILWLLKELIMPDKLWATYVTVPSAILALLVLMGYWGAGFIIISQRVEVSPALACLCTSLNIVGIVLMIGTDAQKYFTLKYKKGLISDGFLQWCRNTNYFGEMMLYLSFALLSQHWFPFAVLAFMWSHVFMSNMIAKDISLRKKDGGAEYVKRTGFVVPNVAGWLEAFLVTPLKARTN
ncbi:hypothetical protein ACHHYP_06323 [Achlya hypogyna]|uniref:Steroid 5-alpha reductase C-terminal domain-containing protein n=1 Tax=Achlya hypogyna TaxID=1202772 RepID=A0A1V9YUG4_ACHHY|nr:hypothetical protein ACHHYP_06323 [Achlya hypogyna]